MARIESAIKRHRQSEKRKVRNLTVRSGIRTAAKRVREAVASGKPDEAKALLEKAVKLLDKAVTKGVLHRNAASRRVSRLTLLVNKAPKKAA